MDLAPLTLLLDPDGPDTHREVRTGPAPGQIALRRTDACALGEPGPFTARDLAADDRPAADTRTAEPVGGFGALLRRRPWQSHYARKPQETFCDELLSGLAGERNDDIAIVTVRRGPPHTGPAVMVP
ncbi:hypothetical protein [Streptomyces sp. SM13]|uniref:hypothetical protein n=1 Tax=Streptomyces sp. SM13 TaxID=1983803 RepID=UPI0015E19076|nr:hypothetical protein [Streptomyces sp. SM13]